MEGRGEGEREEGKKGRKADGPADRICKVGRISHLLDCGNHTEKTKLYRASVPGLNTSVQ